MSLQPQPARDLEGSGGLFRFCGGEEDFDADLLVINASTAS
jgi:hypothetical protein